jgi:hypothetical protein
MQQNFIVYIGDLVMRSISWEWFVIWLILSAVAGLVLPRLTWLSITIATALASLVHVAIHTLLEITKAGGAPTPDAVMQMLQKNTTGPDFAVLAVEFFLYMYMIWIVYLSKHDLFRPWPIEGASTEQRSNVGH